ncbi:type 2 lanthipeptide synthetase LanM family protein [Streptomyces sp. NPDC059894]|uniref:type 2 lanthipeptide synthetase LanM family protein n=1 Tax=unclassified Streptomyces TaxID=2593676 RepID=UPI003646EA1C
MTQPAALPTPRSAHLPHAWWAPALSLAERVAAPGRPLTTSVTVATGRAPWAAGDTAGFAARLDHLGLDERTLHALADEPADRLAERTGTPHWAAYVERALRSARENPAGPAPASDELTGPAVFAPVVRPLVVPASKALERLLGPLPAVERQVVRAAFDQWLESALARQAARTLVRELDAARRAGHLAGAGPRERFASFVAATGGSAGLRGLFTAYPVLARMLGQTALDATEAVGELGLRLAADRGELVSFLLDGRDPGPLARIELGRGDAHQGGRSVAVLGFTDGSRVVYKPRPLEQHALLDGLADWLAERVPGLDLRTPRTVRREDHGWLEFVEHRWCRSVTEADGFYRRQGALLALLYAVDGADMHYENVIASGGQPVLVDAETLLHTGLPHATTAGADPAADALQASVHRTCLLPHLLIGEHGALDISALGRCEEGTYPSEGLRWEDSGLDTMRVVRGPVVSPAAQNQPLPRGGRLESADHRAALLDGFRTAYAAIAAHGAELVGEDGPLAGRADSPARLIVRSTRLYSTLLEESTHPALLGDALARDAVFAVLWTESAHDPARRRLVEHETADLWRGDVPLFVHRPSGTGVRAADGTWLPDLLPVASLAAVREKVGRMNEVDCHDQEWIVSAALAARGAGAANGRPRSELVPAPAPAVMSEPSRLLAAACGIADEIAARAVRSGGRANWLGLERLPGGHWSVLPMGAGLAQGYTGVALFLAQAGLLAGAQRYTTLAREAVRPLPGLLRNLAADPELCAAVGPGAYDGLGGILYSLVRLSTVLEPELAESLPDALTALEHAVAQGTEPGLASGAAGGLAAAVAAYDAYGSPRALELADAVADALAAAAGNGAGPAGFADGDAGVGWALRLHAAHRPGDGHAATADRLLTGALDAALAEPADLSWLSGLPGVAAAAAHVPGAGAGDRTAGSRTAPVAARLAGRRDAGDLSLGHGALGALEALSVLAERGDATASGALARRTGQVLGTVEAQGHHCATPDRVPTPGLLTGLAGIGYGLLRLGFPALVPSALLLRHPCTGRLPGH